MQRDSRVQVATARAHQQTFKRGKAQRTVNRTAPTDCRNTGTIAQVTGNDFLPLKGNVPRLQILRRLNSYVAMRGAVEAVSADVMIPIHLVGQSIDKGEGWHRLVEGGIEHRDHRDIWQTPPAGPNTL